MQQPQRGDDDDAGGRCDPRGEVRSGPGWRWILTRAADFVVARYRKMAAALALAIGAVLLIGAWQALTTVGRQSTALRPLTARGTGRLERAWWQLDFDPRPLGGDGTNWLDLTTAQLCARFRVETGDGRAVTAVACREWPKLRGLWQLTDEAELAPGVPISWAGPSGLPEIELRFSERAYAWLAARPPARWHLTPDVSTRVERLARTEADAVRVFLDDPLRRLAHTWSTTAAPFRVAYDPAQPAHAVPAALVEEWSRPDPASLLVPAGAALGGAVFWAVGLVVFARGQPRVVVAVLVVASLALVPWWGEHVPRLVGRVWEPAGGFVAFFSRELVRTSPPVLIHDPAYAGEPQGVVVTWSLERSRWADVVSRLALERPAGATGKEDLWQALVASAETRAAASGLELEGLPGTSQ